MYKYKIEREGNNMKYLKRLKNTKGIISTLMIISFFCPWYKWWYTGHTPYQSIFQTTKDTALTWIIILLAILSVVICILNLDDSKKNIGLCGCSAIILLLNIISKFTLVSSDMSTIFKSTALGWKLMTVLCVIQIIVAVKELKK